MKKRTFVALALAVVFVLAIAAPAFAQQSISHQATYNMDGDISLKKQAGHLCNTGAEMKQTITGTGKMEKVMDVVMVKGKLSVTDTNDFVTAPDAVRNLTVTSVIELCTPPKYTYDLGEGLWEVVVPAYWLYDDFYTPYEFGLTGPFGWNITDYADDMGFDPVNARQIWAVQVSANPGFSGNLHQDFTAAYGPSAPDLDFGEDLDVNDSNRWAWLHDEDGIASVEIGADFVGDYFTIEQFARTSSGVVKRYIDISSPWSHGYLMIDSTITGMAEVTESFTLDNLPAGTDVPGTWWHLF